MIWPLLLPGVIAGGAFTFCLSAGDVVSRRSLSAALTAFSSPMSFPRSTAPHSTGPGVCAGCRHARAGAADHRARRPLRDDGLGQSELGGPSMAIAMDVPAPVPAFSIARLKARTGDGFLVALAGSVLAFLYLPFLSFFPSTTIARSPAAQRIHLALVPGDGVEPRSPGRDREQLLCRHHRARHRRAGGVRARSARVPGQASVPAAWCCCRLCCPA